MKPLAISIVLSAALWGQRAATYDSTRTIRLEGAVTRVEWVNPRAYVFLDVRDRLGTIANWAVEIGNPLELERSDWSARTVAIGDIVTVEGNPARDTSRRALATSVSAGNRKLFTDRARPAVARSAAAPRWPGGHVRLGPAPGERGYWEVAGTAHLYDRSAGNITMDAEGLLRNLSDVDRVAPFLPWAKAVYEYRQRTVLRDDPVERCQPPGGPRQFQTAHGIQLVEQPEIGRILVLLGGGNRNWRTIATDGREAAHPEDVVLAYYGTSVGKWEGDTLVVDSVGFNESFWFAKGGLPHTEALHLVERFTRTDRNTLRYEVTVDDPRTYSRTWTGGWTLRWVADQDIDEFFCEENAESTFRR